MGLPSFLLVPSQPPGAAWSPNVIIPAASGILGALFGAFGAYFVQRKLWRKHKRVEVLGQLRGLCEAVPRSFYRSAESEAFRNAEQQAWKLAIGRGQKGLALHHYHQVGFWLRYRAQATLTTDRTQQGLSSCVALIAVLFKGLSADKEPISTILGFGGLEAQPCCSQDPIEWSAQETDRLRMLVAKTYRAPLERLIELVKEQI